MLLFLDIMTGIMPFYENDTTLLFSWLMTIGRRTPFHVHHALLHVGYVLFAGYFCLDHDALLFVCHLDKGVHKHKWLPQIAKSLLWWIFGKHFQNINIPGFAWRSSNIQLVLVKRIDGGNACGGCPLCRLPWIHHKCLWNITVWYV